MGSSKWAPMKFIGRILLMSFALFSGVNVPVMSSYQCKHGVEMKRVNSTLSLQESSLDFEPCVSFKIPNG